MNSLVTYSPPSAPQPYTRPASGGEDERLDLLSLFEAARRRYLLFLIVAGLVFALALVLTFSQTPKFTATSTVMMDPHQVQLLQTPTESGSPDRMLSTEAVGTQVELIKSRTMAERVVNELRLDEDPRYSPKNLKPGLRGRLMQGIASLFGATPREALTPEERHQLIVDDVMAHVNAERLGLTYIIEISYIDKFPARAAMIANAFARIYVAQSLEGKSDASKVAGGYISSHLKELSDQAAHDAAAVQAYKVQHNLIGSEGATLTQQEISNLNQQIATAQAEAVADRARLDTARAQLAHGSSGDDVGAALESPVVSSLRAQRASVSGLLAQLNSRYGPKHPDVLKAERQLQDIDAQIHAEINRVISNLQARAQVSKERLESLESALGHSRGALASDTQAQSGLIELQQKAAASQTLYDNFLARFKEIMSTAGAEQSDARVVGLARTPDSPTSPKIILDLALGFIISSVLGAVAAVAAELSDRSLSSGLEVERRLHVPYLGSIPLLGSVARDNRRGPTEYVVANPFSVFTEAFRNLRVSVSRAPGRPTVLAVASPLTAEGKTTTSVCLAEVAAMQGLRTVIVDCDLRRRSLQNFLPAPPQIGLTEVLLGKATLDQALLVDPESGVTYLPISTAKLRADDVLGGEAMAQVLEDLKRRFDFVVLDTAPILALADARILASMSDAVIVLCRWRRTPEDALKSSLRLLQAAGAPVAGVVLTRVDVRRQSAHGYGDSTYYYRETQQYYAS